MTTHEDQGAAYDPGAAGHELAGREGPAQAGEVTEWSRAAETFTVDDLIQTAMGLLDAGLLDSVTLESIPDCGDPDGPPSAIRLVVDFRPGAHTR